jgi:hypothetical protein
MVGRRSVAGSFSLVWQFKAPLSAVFVSLCASPALLAHDWYTGLVDPVTGYSCCGGQDCRPVPREGIRFAENGDMELFLDGAC